MLKQSKKYDFDDEGSPIISKQKEIFNELVDKRLDEITEVDKKVNCNDLVDRYKGKIPDKKFDKYDNVLDLIDKIKNGKIKFSDVKNDQTNFKSYLGEIKKGSKKLKEQKNALNNIEILYKARRRRY